MWIQLIIMVVSILIEIATRPKQQTPPAATLADVNIPTINQGTPICVVFGDVWIDNWFVMWYGDMSSTPIKSKGKK